MLLLITVVFNDYSNESADTLVQNLVKDVTLQKLASKINTDPTCSGAYLKSMSVSKGSIILDIENCDSINIQEIASIVENTLCGNLISDNVVSCGNKNYELIKQ